MSTATLTDEQMVEVIFALAAAIENLVAAPDNLLARISHAITEAP